jgi:hypothetical protein
MNDRKYIVGSFVVMATMLFSLQAFALKISPADGKWYRVTEPAQEGHSQCEIGRSTWKFTVSWKPIIYQGKPWLTYIVGGYKCAQKVPVRCSGGRCSAEIGSCALPAARTWVSIVADYGSNGGVRVSGFEEHSPCS